MGCKTVAIAFLGLWLAFQSIELLEQAALFEFSEQETDRAVDQAMAGFGMALIEEHQSESCDRGTLSSTSPGRVLRDANAWNPALSNDPASTIEEIPIYARQRKLRI